METENRDAGEYRIDAVATSFEVVRGVLELGTCGVRELAAHLDIPKSTVHVHLTTLEDLGYVINRQGTYQLSYRFLEIGGQVRHQAEIYQVTRDEIDELARETGHVATAGIEENGYRVMLFRTEPSGSVFNNAPTGEYTRMHWTSVGKALLATRSTEEVTSIVDRRGLPRATKRTITEREKLHEELETIREQGYAIEDEERVLGVKAVAVPIESDDDLPDAAISVAGPKHELDPDRVHEEVLPALRNVANVVELRARHY
ncbi:IclR family transcriptional regulator [Halopenitus sp. H-Gu1]|uniref:IclR family transcriptional regulator n=1 Tax=Halopenitus sp. H-Gu1 TaxID=3242697 RepID=UPI00359D662B